MYKILIYDNTWTIFKWVLEKYSSLSVENILNWVSKSDFILPNIERYTRDLLKKKNIVKIYRNWIQIFEWVIIWSIPTLKNITVNCECYSHIFKHRFLWTQYTWTYSEIIDWILADWQNDWPLFVDVDYLVSWSADIDLNNKSLFDAISTIQSSWKEYIFNSNILVIKDSIWEDKSNLIKLKFLENKSNENNIKDVRITEEWSKIYNKVKWYSWELESNKIDQDSIDEYWPFKTVKQFSEAKDQDTLDSLTQNYLDENKNELFTIDFLPLTEKIDINNINLWDILNIKIQKWYMQVDENLRIVWKKFNIKWESSLSEEISFSISTWSKYIKWFFETIAEMNSRIIILENK